MLLVVISILGGWVGGGGGRIDDTLVSRSILLLCSLTRCTLHAQRRDSYFRVIVLSSLVYKGTATKITPERNGLRYDEYVLLEISVSPSLSEIFP